MAENISFEKVTTEYYDVLKELGNIGAGNATTALAQMLQTKVDMKVPQVRLLDFKDVGVVMGGEEQLVVGIYLAVEGGYYRQYYVHFGTECWQIACVKAYGNATIREWF